MPRMSLHAVVKLVLFSGILFLGVQLARLVIRGRTINMAGRPAISPPLFVLAKTSLAVSFLCVVWQGLFGLTGLPVVQGWVFLVLFVPGCVILGLAFHRLGASLRMGLPGEQTDLVTTGVYRISRNPIYLGLFLVMGASLVYAFSWVNAAAVVIAVVLHDRIAHAEETFLAGRFPAYREYRARVRRYL